MDAIGAIAHIHTIQNAFLVLSALKFTAYLFPPPATVNDCAVYDFIVIGGGSAGCVVASRLSEDGENSVLLIEAGDDPPIEVMLPGAAAYLKNSRVDWNHTTVKHSYIGKYQKNQVYELTRGKMLGGTSGMNLMIYVRGSPHDFNTWADIVGDRTWAYENVLPYFTKSEKLDDSEIQRSLYGPSHGYSGNLGVKRQFDEGIEKYLQAFNEVGNKIVLDTSTGDMGYTQPLYTIGNGLRQITSYAFLSPIKDRKNLHVWRNTLATKIIFDSRKNAVAVEALTSDDRKITVKARKEIVVSAGTINSPQLLMLSGIGPKKHLQEMKIPVISDLPVGKNLVDHHSVLVPFKMGKLPPSQPPLNPHEFPTPSFIGFVAENKSQSFPDYQSYSLIIRNSNTLLGLCAFSLNLEDSICQSLYESCKGHEVLLTNLLLLHPKSNGEILLKSRDPKKSPLIYPGYLTNPDDLGKLVDYLEDFTSVLDSSYFADVNAELMPFNFSNCGTNYKSKEYWKCYVRSSVKSLYHYVGTCSMGTVVDSNLRVKGVKGLRVADASVMPYITSGNTNAPTIMIGEKAADMIINSMKCSKKSIYIIINL